MQDSSGNPAPSRPPRSLGSGRACIPRWHLLERLRKCAEFDKNLFRACLHALYTERIIRNHRGLGTGAIGMSATRIADGSAGADCNTCQEPEDRLRQILNYLQDFDEREKFATDREALLNSQYEALEAELSQSVPDPTVPSFHIPAVAGMSRLCLIGMVISRKEHEQMERLHDINDHDFEANGVFIPKLPTLLREGRIVERISGLLKFIPHSAPRDNWTIYTRE